MNQATEDAINQFTFRCGKIDYYSDQTCTVCAKVKTWQFFRRSAICKQCRNVKAYHKYILKGNNNERQNHRSRLRYWNKKREKEENSMEEQDQIALIENAEDNVEVK